MTAVVARVTAPFRQVRFLFNRRRAIEETLCLGLRVGEHRARQNCICQQPKPKNPA